MKALFLVLGNKSVASSRVRVYSYLPYLRQSGIKAFVMNYTPFWQSRSILSRRRQAMPAKLTAKIYSFAVLSLLFILAPFFDAVFIQKVALSRPSVWFLSVLNRNIVFDFDDAIFFYQDITYILKKARCVTVSNRYLMDFAGQYNRAVYEVPSPVEPVSRFASRDNGRIIIGWIGSQTTSKYLKPLGGVFSVLKGKFKNLTIELVGVEKDAVFDLRLEVMAVRWSPDSEQRHFERVDIGIMPLPDDEWTRGKAGYKLLQYMSAGIPCVASPVGVNKEIITDGLNGFLADTNEEWVDRLSLLISDSALRSRLGQQGLNCAMEHYSYKTTAPILIGILEGMDR